LYNRNVMSVLVPTSLDGALAALAADPDAHVLAGGTDLMVEVNFGHRRPASVVAINRIAELSSWHRSTDGANLVLGAGVTYRSMEHGELARLVPALAQAARTVGSPQIRNVATIGGNLATCSPAGDGLPVLSALDASVELASAAGRRMVSVHDFMVGVKRTARQPDELIVAVHLPVLRGWQGYSKVGVRNAMVIATASVCLATDLDGQSVRIAMGAVGPTIIRARAAEAWVATQVDWTTGSLTGDPAAIAAELGERVRADARPIDDHRSTAAYRRHAVGVLAGRLLSRAFPT
jgi:CO/xanthine dehydrogenase FAD-binding subunit